LVALVVGLSTAVTAADRPLLKWQGQTMGSTYTVQVVDAALGDEQVEALKAEIDARLREVNRQMSHYQPESELSRFNRAPAGSPFKVSAQFAGVMRQALELQRVSGGAFDPTLGPILNLWGFGEKSEVRSVPSAEQLAEARTRTGCQHLRVTAENTLCKDIAGLQLNLGAIAKGFGVDEMSRVLQGRGLTNFYVSISGDLYVQGHNASGQKWQVGVSAPIPDWRPGDPVAAVLSVSGRAVSTSGDYQKYFVDVHGHRLCHIFDPRTGRPIQHNLASVTVVAETSTVADGLSTTLFVLGYQEGLRFVESFASAAALFIVHEADGTFRTVASSRFKEFTGYTP
jgi:thiamine biosynthesis lipoprotein